MMRTALHPVPRPRRVLLEQVRAMGLALRREALVAAALVGLVTLWMVVEILRDGDVVDFHPEHQMLVGVMGLLLPIAVWKGEERFGGAFLWTLPVDRRRHALAKVLAGWVWLMGAVALLVLWLLALTLLSGGSVLAEETIRLVPASFDPLPGTTLDPGVIRTVHWGPEPLLWLVPFTAATAMYLIASAVTLGLRHPLRWVAGAVFTLFLFAAAADLVGRAADSEWLIFAPSRLIHAVFFGPYGLDTLLTARTEHFKVEATLATGERVLVWRGLPDLGQWAVATLLWTGAGLAAVWAAAYRHRERRRG